MQLEQGKALIITGPQGSGKTTLARQIASENGSFIEVDGSVLLDKHRFHEAIKGGMGTVIVDEFPCSKNYAAALKALITSKKVRYREPDGTAHITVNMPNFIVCALGSAEFLNDESAGKRYHVIAANA